MLTLPKEIEFLRIIIMIIKGSKLALNVFERVKILDNFRLEGDIKILRAVHGQNKQKNSSSLF